MDSPSPLKSLTIRSTYPMLADSLANLPWHLPLQEWPGNCPLLVDVPRGRSRHPVVFINYEGTIFALKQLPTGIAKKEYDLLSQIEDLRLPVVVAVGHAETQHSGEAYSILVTRYLDRSIPYRMLFMREELGRYRDSLLDAMAGLMVQLHLAGVFWGDCSLSNTLFRRDAGALQAYMVDAETAEIYPPRLSPTLRLHDLEIMEIEVEGDLGDLQQARLIPSNYPIVDTGTYIRQRYQSLWEEITREGVIYQNEGYRVQERIRALNSLGFSVGDVEMVPAQDGNKVRFRVMVTDRSFHRDQLFDLTGIVAEERQARQMMNEILEVRATLLQNNNVNTPLSVAAYHWLEHSYLPVIRRLESLSASENIGLVELYCQVLEHKWFLSERAHHDVGHQAAVEDFLENVAKKSAE